MPDATVLIVGRSDVTCIVVAKIVERCGLRSVCARPEGAGSLMVGMRPAAIVLDGGADNRECDDLMDGIAALREGSGRSTPAVLLLSTRNAEPGGLLGGIVDAVVAKPITPERMQPLILRLTGAR